MILPLKFLFVSEELLVTVCPFFYLFFNRYHPCFPFRFIKKNSFLFMSLVFSLLPLLNHYFLSFISFMPLFFKKKKLTYSRWTSSLPSCMWSQRIFPFLPGSRLTIFYRDASSALLQLVNQWLNFTVNKNCRNSVFIASNRRHPCPST